MQRLQPGSRDKQTAAPLRILYIERKLKYAKTLTKKQRRSLQARKNTAIFRERKRHAKAYEELFEHDIPEIINQLALDNGFTFPRVELAKPDSLKEVALN